MPTTCYDARPRRSIAVAYRRCASISIKGRTTPSCAGADAIFATAFRDLDTSRAQRVLVTGINVYPSLNGGPRRGRNRDEHDLDRNSVAEQVVPRSLQLQAPIV